MESSNSVRTKPLYRGTQVIWYVLGLLEALLAFRFVLKLLADNPGAGFSSFSNTATQPFVSPFLSVFHISRVEGNVAEWTTLLAMFVYWLVAWGAIKLLFMGKDVSTPEAAAKLDELNK